MPRKEKQKEKKVENWAKMTLFSRGSKKRVLDKNKCVPFKRTEGRRGLECDPGGRIECRSD